MRFGGVGVADGDPALSRAIREAGRGWDATPDPTELAGDYGTG